MNSEAFQRLLCAHAVRSLEKQFHLQELAGEDDWSADLDAGTFSIGRYTWRCELLGSESSISNTWQWGWANTDGYSADVLRTSLELRSLGSQTQVPELTEPQFPLDTIGAHALSLVAVGVSGADAYYRGPYDDGAAFLIIRDPAFPSLPAMTADRFSNLFTTLIRRFAVADHRGALQAYAASGAVALRSDGASDRLEFNDGSGLTCTFDHLNRLTALEGRLER
ncbi:MAG TPA: hypothetical protein VF796_09890 [Humisphaera sp.]